jgi:hypothetical protein
MVIVMNMSLMIANSIGRQNYNYNSYPEAELAPELDPDRAYANLDRVLQNETTKCGRLYKYYCCHIEHNDDDNAIRSSVYTTLIALFVGIITVVEVPYGKAGFGVLAGTATWFVTALLIKNGIDLSRACSRMTDRRDCMRKTSRCFAYCCNPSSWGIEIERDALFV